MSDHIYKSVEITGTSRVGVEDAVQNAVSKAGETLRNLHWLQVGEIRGAIENGKVSRWQVTMKLGFTLDE